MVKKTANKSSTTSEQDKIRRVGNTSSFEVELLSEGGGHFLKKIYFYQVDFSFNRPGAPVKPSAEAPELWTEGGDAVARAASGRIYATSFYFFFFLSLLLFFSPLI